MPAHRQQAGPDGPVDLAGQDGQWLSGVWCPATGPAQGNSQQASQHSDIAWNAFLEGASGKVYAGIRSPWAVTYWLQ